MPKHILIVGYGSAALAALKALQDLPEELRVGWRVSVFERREGLGGQWLPDDGLGEIALTGLYDRLRTNTPVHMMTYPHEPFPDHTDLFPHWQVVLDYLQNYATKFGLYSSKQEDWDTAEETANKYSLDNRHCDRNNEHVHAPHRCTVIPAKLALQQLPRRIVYHRELYSTTWICDEGVAPVEFHDKFDTIIDATGHLVHPSIPELPGKEIWLAHDPRRKIIHSASYRGPEAYADRTVLIVGTGPSGLDGALQIGTLAKKVYHAASPSVVLPSDWPFERRARLTGFSQGAVLLGDGSSLTDVDIVYLGTGFIIRYEYLERGGALFRRPGQPLPRLEDEMFDGVVSTDLYTRPLFMHTMSFARSHALASLFWIGNIMSTSYRFSNAIQAALIAWILAVPTIIPSREDMSRILAEDEARIRNLGRSLEKLGHRQGAPHLGESEEYQRGVIAFLESHGIEVGNSENKAGVVMEPWREEIRKDFWMCMRGWARLEREDRTQELLELAQGEEGFVKVGRIVVAEQRQFEQESSRDPEEQEISGWL